MSRHRPETESSSPTLHLFDGSVLDTVFTEHFHDALPNVEYLPIDFPNDIAQDHADIV